MLYVADTGHNRTLGYGSPISTGEPPVVVIGQQDFRGASCNGGGRHPPPGPATLCAPTVAIADGAGNLFVADTGNNRVLFYPAPLSNGPTATIVLGQSGLASNVCANGKGGHPVTASGLCGPTYLALDERGDLWVSDTKNNRVVMYPPPFSTGEAATIVIGQPNATVNRCVRPKATSLCAPQGVALDGGNLLVGDDGDARVLEFPAPLATGEAATIVLGQSKFTTRRRRASKSGLADAIGLALDTSGDLFVADKRGNRVVRFGAPLVSGEEATLVLGQADFNAHPRCLHRASSNQCGPTGVALDPAGDAYVADTRNSRTLVYAAPLTTGAPPGVELRASGNKIVEQHPLGVSFVPAVFVPGAVVAGGLVMGPTGVTVTGSVQSYRPDANRFTSAASVGSARAHAAVASLQDGGLILAGGDDFNVSATYASAEIYNPSTGQWTTACCMSARRSYAVAVQLTDGRVLIAGGGDGTNILRSADIYDPVTGRFSATGSMNDPRDVFMAARLADGRVLVAGGETMVAGFISDDQTAEVYDPREGTFTMTNTMNELHSLGAMVPVKVGGVESIMVAAGQAPLDPTNPNILYPSPHVELYDETLGTWSFTTPMNEGQYLFGLAPVGDGDALAVGGSGGREQQRCGAVEFFDASNLTWTTILPAASSPFGSYSQAIDLSNGQVLAIGGLSCDITPGAPFPGIAMLFDRQAMQLVAQANLIAPVPDEPGLGAIALSVNTAIVPARAAARARP